MIQLHHVTHRRLCPSIAAHGFRDSHRMAAGVYLAPPGMLWVAGGFEELDFGLLGPEDVAFAFEVPEDVADQFAVREQVPSADDPGDDIPDDLEQDDPAAWDTTGLPVYEYIIPAAVANLYCVGLVHWTGDRPLTDAEVRAIESRRLDAQTA